jgi:hypothetical protein
MKDERAGQGADHDSHANDISVKRFLLVAAMAVAAGFVLSFAYSRWSGAPALTSALAREAPDDSAEGDDRPVADEASGAAAEAAQADAASADDASDLNGDWTVTTHVTSATRQEFVGLKLAYRLQLKQDGERVTGNGQKISENGKSLTAKQRTPIAVEGERKRDRVMLTFTERGARRESGGTFFLRRDDDAWRGTFASDAAGSKGDVIVERLTPSTSQAEQKQKGRAR